MKLVKLLPILLSLFIVSCANNNPSGAPSVENEAKPVAYSGIGTLKIAPVIFAKDLQVREAVRKECQLLTKLPGFVQSYAQDQYAGIDLDAKRSTKSDYLKIEITDLPKYKKNAWAGRGGQWVTVKGALLRKRKKTMTFTANRGSMGGFMGAYKGTCALLGGCTKTLGNDIAEWLKNPVDGATLGDM
ncbi:conserved hypothetical protein [Bathymodiolus platifrons methanotrophic gill symbiont]|uniref:hypothetical protein n=1 Tax=Bathymodiolus platifrons methanotrophic gill symbiont TaxID=113268 RepID=UPI000B41E640|nr:hypothetical protein [Bathymodiolus platifrons methanotrophic gill symbiont]GAW87874.1 conserved hypothetical protein [Bathymodiolus platifrons methanotrophic gill symbiont]